MKSRTKKIMQAKGSEQSKLQFLQAQAGSARVMQLSFANMCVLFFTPGIVEMDDLSRCCSILCQAIPFFLGPLKRRYMLALESIKERTPVG